MFNSKLVYCKADTICKSFSLSPPDVKYSMRRRRREIEKAKRESERVRNREGAKVRELEVAKVRKKTK